MDLFTGWDIMTTCMFCGHELGRIPISYAFSIPRGDDEEPLQNEGQAHVACIMEFESAHYDYDQIAPNFIAQWEMALAQ
jgi:hypothetical protein